MATHKRYIFPVGQGGFSCEIIEDFVVVYDCGSATSSGVVEEWIDHLSEEIVHINILFISHFDKDHVNSIRYLLSNIHVRQAVTSFIPSEMRALYGVYTNGAYGAIMRLFDEYNVETQTIGGRENTTRDFNFDAIWEWIAKSMMSNADFANVKTYLSGHGFDINRVEDADYVETEKDVINDAFKAEFGSKGPNAKGLIVLSQHCKNVATRGSEVLRGDRWSPYCLRIIARSQESSCLYVGDADLRNVANRSDVKDFVQRNRAENPLLFMQMPHHGSRYNRGVSFETDFPANYYIVNDVDTERVQKSPSLFKSLTSQRKLLVARGLYLGMVGNITEI